MKKLVWGFIITLLLSNSVCGFTPSLCFKKEPPQDNLKVVKKYLPQKLHWTAELVDGYFSGKGVIAKYKNTTIVQVSISI